VISCPAAPITAAGDHIASDGVLKPRSRIGFIAIDAITADRQITAWYRDPRITNGLTSVRAEIEEEIIRVECDSRSTIKAVIYLLLSERLVTEGVHLICKLRRDSRRLLLQAE